MFICRTQIPQRSIDGHLGALESLRCRGRESVCACKVKGTDPDLEIGHATHKGR